MSVDLNEFFIEAPASGSIKVIKQLLAKGADPQPDDSYPFWDAVSHGRLEAISLLLSLPDQKAHSHWALQTAVENGHLGVVRLLLPLSDAARFMLHSRVMLAAQFLHKRPTTTSPAKRRRA